MGTSCWIPQRERFAVPIAWWTSPRANSPSFWFCSKPVDGCSRARNSKNAAFVENVTDLNVRRSVRTIVNRSYILERLIESGKVAIIGAKHDLATGSVAFFDDTFVHDEDSMRAVTGRTMASGAAAPGKRLAKVG